MPVVEDSLVIEVLDPFSPEFLADRSTPTLTNTDPPALDIRRANAKEQVVFGSGDDLCLGAALALLPAKVVFEELTRRGPGLRLVSGQQLPFDANIWCRGPQSLLVEWDA